MVAGKRRQQFMRKKWNKVFTKYSPYFYAQVLYPGILQQYLFPFLESG
jgi:hypothetical protein